MHGLGAICGAAVVVSLPGNQQGCLPAYLPAFLLAPGNRLQILI